MGSSHWNLGGNMFNRNLALGFGVAGMVLLTGCPSAELAPCQTLPSVQGGYVVKLTRKEGVPTGCTEADTPAQFSDIWAFDTVADRNVIGSSILLPIPDTGPVPDTLIFKGTFSAERSDSNDTCTIPALSTISDSSSGTFLSYAVTNMTWLSGSAYQGAEFKAEVAFTRGTCSANYDALSLSPAVGCETTDDCDPFKTPFSSGIFSVFDQGCKTDAWTAGATDFLGSTGVCFLNGDYPSLGGFKK
jgi:hypothetical protein